MSKHIIDDGYTRNGYIKAVPRLHDSLTFRFRPMLAEEVDAVADAVEGKPAREKSRIVRGVIVKQVVDWDTENASGEGTAEVNAENIRRLSWLVVNQMYNMVAGLIPVDEDLATRDDNEPTIVSDLVESTAAGVPYGVTVEDRDRKNLSTG